MSKPFIKSGVCQSGSNCPACRDKEGGRAVRASWRALGYVMPGDGDDWECPKEARRLAWGPVELTVKGKSRGLGDSIAKLTSMFGVRPCGKCKKRQAKLNELVPYVK